MATRMRTVYRVVPVLDNEAQFAIESRHTSLEAAEDRAAAHNNNMSDTSRVYFEVFQDAEEYTPLPEEMTIEELEETLSEWEELLRAPKQSDWMGVADDYLNYPGDMEGYADYYSEVSRELTSRLEESA